MSAKPDLIAVNQRWLSAVPRGWTVPRLRHLCRISTGSGDTVHATPDGDYPFVVRSPELLRAPYFDHDCEAILTVGDGAVGEVFHHLNGKFLAHQRVYVLSQFRNDVYPRFLFYYFASHFRLMAQDGSARTTVDSVRRWMLADMPVALPPITEQKRIADYLDRETAQIDALISAQERLTDLLRERLRAVLAHRIAQPPSARQTTVKRVLEKLSRPAQPGHEVVTAYRDGRVTLRSKRRETGYTFSDQEQGYQLIEPGDLVFHALDGFAGAVGVSDSRGVATPVYHVCRPRGSDNLEFLALYLRFLGLSGFLETQAPNTRQRSVDFRNWSTFGRVPLLLPPPEAQAAIVREIHREQEKTLRLSAEAHRLIALAKERRAALITAAVTGQIEVSEE